MCRWEEMRRAFAQTIIAAGRTIPLKNAQTFLGPCTLVYGS
jgi:hypothetical protein